VNFARRVDHAEIRDAIDSVLGEGPGAMLEATAKMSVEDAYDYAWRLVTERSAHDRVRLVRRAGWLHIEPSAAAS
jgi:hypothetical protein